MAGLVERLWQLGRTHLNDFLEQRWPSTATSSPWEQERPRQERAEEERFRRTPPPEEPPTSQSGLPRTEALVESYRRLDLPFGAPMAQVNQRWKTYLKKCHPDRYAHDPAKQAEATILTQQLNDAHQKIKLAWERSQR